MTVWFDETDISDFESITHGIREGLANAKALVAVYSDLYPTRRACQWELTAAFIGAQHEGDPRRRVFVINPEDHTDHIHPVELRDALFRGLPRDADEETLVAIAETVYAAAAKLPGPFSDSRPMAAPPWYGGKGLGSNRFVGRVQLFWQLHSALFANDAAVITAQAAPGHVQMRAMGGMGKSLLAEEYALRFGAAYPGGVFLVKATGDRDDQNADFAARLGLDVEGMEAAQIEGWLERKLREADKPYLWLIDDLPAGMGEDDRRRWFAPNGLGKTLITTRSREYGSTGHVIDLGVLNIEEGYALLTAKRKPEGAEEEGAARDIVGELGGHALAIDVAGGALAKLVGRESLQGFLAKIRASGQDALALAAELQPDLPNGHERSIATTLFWSINLLDEPSRDFLRLASVLASDVIPYDLVDRVFHVLWCASNDSPWGATAVVDVVLRHCLAESAPRTEGPGCYSVHPLVARTIRLYDKAARTDLIRSVAIRALGEILPRVCDVRAHQGLRAHVAHARHIASSPDTPDETALLSWVGRYEYERGAFVSARAYFERAVEATQRLLGDDHPDTLTARNNLAGTLCAQGELDAAQKLQKTVLEARRRVLGGDHPHTLTVKNNLAGTLYAQGKLIAARELAESVLEGRQRLFGPGHPDTLTARNNLSAIISAQGDPQGVLASDEAVFEESRHLLGEDHSITLMARNNLATTLYTQGDLAGALKHEEVALEACRRLFGDEHPNTVRVKTNLAEILKAVRGDGAGSS
jgi:tetratricopeptide (TPR) repeat protein